jgi:hypothetical protein
MAGAVWARVTHRRTRGHLPVDQGNEHLRRALTLAHDLLHERFADLDALRTKHPVAPACRELLLAAGPMRRVRE